MRFRIVFEFVSALVISETFVALLLCLDNVYFHHTTTLHDFSVVNLAGAVSLRCSDCCMCALMDFHHQVDIVVDPSIVCFYLLSL